MHLIEKEIATLAFSAYCGAFLFGRHSHGFPVFVVDVDGCCPIPIRSFRTFRMFIPFKHFEEKNCSRKKNTFSVQFGCASVLIAAIIVLKCYHEHCIFYYLFFSNKTQQRSYAFFFHQFSCPSQTSGINNKTMLFPFSKPNSFPLQKRICTVHRVVESLLFRWFLFLLNITTESNYPYNT